MSRTKPLTPDELAEWLAERRIRLDRLKWNNFRVEHELAVLDRDYPSKGNA